MNNKKLEVTFEVKKLYEELVTLEGSTFRKRTLRVWRPVSSFNLEGFGGKI